MTIPRFNEPLYGEQGPNRELRFRVAIVSDNRTDLSALSALTQCLRMVPEYDLIGTRFVLDCSADSERSYKSDGLLAASVLRIDSVLERKREKREREREGPPFNVYSIPQPVALPPHTTLPSDQWKAIRDANVDLLFYLGDESPSSALLAASRLGLISAIGSRAPSSHSVSSSRDAEPVMMERIEVFHHVQKQPSTRLLNSLNARRSISPTRNRALLNTRIADLMTLMGRRVTGGCAEPSAIASQGPSPALDSRSEHSTTHSRLRFKEVSGIISRRVNYAIASRQFSERWVMAYKRDASRGMPRTSSDMAEFELLLPPAGTQWADPFPVNTEGQHLIFFEEELAGQHGHISVAELLDDGTLSKPKVALEIGTHLSYPCVFSYDGHWWMVPESSSRGAVSLFRATDFPHVWEKECDLLSKHRLVDCTLFRHADAWWMLGCRVGADEGPYEDLEAWRARELTGPWEPHERNPIVSDAEKGRPAGHVFEEGGQLWRPAQNCSVRYGYGLGFHRIGGLTLSEFEEQAGPMLLPDWEANILGMHTYNRTDALEVSDFFVRQRR